MQIQCECGKFRADLKQFPGNTPGRLACYCDDCQRYLHYLGRTDLMDAAGGTEIIPVYPSEIEIVAGKEVLKCTRLSPNGLLRWSTTCCNTPVANTKPKFPWVGLFHCVYSVKDEGLLERTLGPVRSRIQGRFAKGGPPAGTSPKLSFRDAFTVLPFILKGLMLRKTRNSPFFAGDGVTPIVEPHTLTREERDSLRAKLR